MRETFIVRKSEDSFKISIKSFAYVSARRSITPRLFYLALNQITLYTVNELANILLNRKLCEKMKTCGLTLPDEWAIFFVQVGDNGEIEGFSPTCLGALANLRINTGQMAGLTSSDDDGTCGASVRLRVTGLKSAPLSYSATYSDFERRARATATSSSSW